MTSAKRDHLYVGIATLLCALFACGAIVSFVDAQGIDKSAPLCVNKETCHECIQTPSCAWCQQENHGERPRCFESGYLDICPRDFIVNPDVSEDIIANAALTRGRSVSASGGGGQYVSGFTYENSSSFSHSERGSITEEHGSYAGGSSASASRSRGIVQISPQRVSLKMRINQAHRLHLSYSQAEDYPVDLYYLMDLSKSMEDDKDNLSKLGDSLSSAMRKMTSNFKLGFGSFVDKVLMPYVSTIPKKLEHPCDGCEAPYGYRNHMPLSTNTSAFSTEVKKAAVSGNLDAPEGGFDAIMQAIACRNQIGWREQARRLLVFSTDASFHYAGDGKLGGVIAPNDGECHLNEQGFYTQSTEQDYPSISQINQKVKENSINIIFAVTASQQSVYEKLSKHIEGSSSATLSDDSSNVVQLVQAEYSKISSSVEMKDNATSHVKITYYSACLTGGPEKATAKCDGLKVNDVVNFTAEILITSCPKDPRDWKQTIQIYPVGINESLVIDLTMLCSCDCENPNSRTYEINSPKCSTFGTYMCGICVCDDLHDGHKCECNSSDVHTDKNDFGCRPDNTTTTDCSNRGDCVCGKCRCHQNKQTGERFSGKYCECSNLSCERNNNQLCSGPDHGACECGDCICKPEWEGNACECLKSKEPCMPTNGGEMCSGHGECVCGVCKCKSSEEGRYSGKFCEKCPTCSGRCHELKDCVQCQMYQTGPLKKPEDCAANCTTFTPKGVEKVEIDENKDEQMCMFYDEDECKFIFKYSEQDKYTKGDRVDVYAQQERECPPKVFMLGIVLGVIAAIVLVGLAILLLWKLLTTIHDRREFARFEKERMNAKWDTGENPIYKQATSTFKNPTYAAGK